MLLDTRSKFSLLCTALLSAVVLLVTSGSAQAQYGSPIALGSLPGAAGTEPYPLAINASDVVVGGQYIGTGSSTVMHAWVWSKGTMTDIGTLPGFTESTAAAINASGQVVGYSASIEHSWDGLGHAFLWLPAPAYGFPAGMTDLNMALPPGSGWELYGATGINAMGQICGSGAHYVGGVGKAPRAFLMTPASPGVFSILDLGSLSSYPGYDTAIATGVNAAGQVTGTSYNTSMSAPYPRAFLTPPGAPMTAASDLGPVPDVFGAGAGTYSYGVAISDSGHVSGWGNVPYGGAYVDQGFFYGATGMSPLSRFEPGSWCLPYGMNASDDIVGVAAASAFMGGHAVIWPHGGPSLIDLNAYAPAGWELGLASAINDSKDMVGVGSSAGTPVAWIWPAARAVSGLTIKPASVTGGAKATGTVTLSGPAPGTGAVVTLTSDTPSAASVPASVTVPAGATTATFSITTYPLPSSAAVKVGITASSGGMTKGASIVVKPPVLKSLALSPSTVKGGNTVTGTVTLTGVAGFPVTVGLSTTNPAATVPASVTVPPGSSSATFTITTVAVSSSTSGMVIAAYSIAKSKTLTITP